MYKEWEHIFDLLPKPLEQPVLSYQLQFSVLHLRYESMQSAILQDDISFVSVSIDNKYL